MNNKINLLIDKPDFCKTISKDQIINVTGGVGSGKSSYSLKFKNNKDYIVIGLDSLKHDYEKNTQNSYILKLRKNLTTKYKDFKDIPLSNYYLDIVEFIKAENKIGIIEGGDIFKINDISILKGEIIIKRTSRLKSYFRAVIRDYKNPAWRKNLNTLGLIKRFFHCAIRRTKHIKRQKHIELFIKRVYEYN